MVQSSTQLRNAEEWLETTHHRLRNGSTRMMTPAAAVLLCSARRGEWFARRASEPVWHENNYACHHCDTHFVRWFLNVLTATQDG
jgi:hypothetical protein